MDRFRKDQEGAILPVFALMVIVLVVIGGGAIDVSRAVNAREKLSYALDAAALAVAVELSGREMTDDQVRRYLQDSFNANLKASDWKQTAINNIAVDINPDEGQVTVSSQAWLKNYFISIAGYGIDQIGPEKFAFGTSATVNYSRFNVEIAVALDVTNSIGTVPGGLNSVKSAAQRLVDILVPEQGGQQNSKVRLSVVPYSWGVAAPGYVNKLIVEGRKDGSRCITARANSARFKEGPYWNNFGNTGFNQGSQRFYYISYDRWYGPQTDCPFTSVQPLTADKRDLTNTIRNLQLVGGTAGQAGVAWSWYTLSPEWSPIWPIESQPLPYQTGPKAKNRKIAILMTDGETNTYWDWERVERRQCRWRGGNNWDCTGQDRWEWTQRGWYALPSYNVPPVQRALEFCRLMKAKGIEVYSVFFQTGTAATPHGLRLMQECASSTDHYYRADNRTELEGAFQNIAKKIQKIYLSR
ncbi:TadE/TadG family type IV pilus assembly protein [Labrenzia sp. PHM005]|uniref:TadE/TadG family type IV pilus assembly protein n=1 Tax=Labrenzia sp. PHM005 TaxID=2590016 RepID=UPI00143D253A|nr:TadE/TadG family type IV pilus assembly protein [Labrenzia sp. PHM005]